MLQALQEEEEEEGAAVAAKGAGHDQPGVVTARPPLLTR